MPKVTTAGLAALAMLTAATHVAAQTDPRLVAVVRNAQDGQTDSARATVQRLLASTPPTDTIYPQVLYTAAIVASEAADMRRYLQRVAIEFPASSWADDALLRLVQLDYATSELDGAAQNLERIAIDFPATPLFPQVAYWAGRTYFDLKKDAQACRWLADGMARSRDDVEIQTQLGYLYQRCGSASADSQPPADTTKPAPAAPSTAPAAPAPAPTPPATASAPATPAPAATRFRIQIAAVSTAAAAEAAVQKAQAAGYQAITVNDGKLYKVRVGSYGTRTEAQKAATAIKTKLGGNAFIVIDQ